MSVSPPMLAEDHGISLRTVEMLSIGPGAGYADHVVHRSGCWCSVDGPDKMCDAGEALWRLRPSGKAGRT